MGQTSYKPIAKINGQPFTYRFMDMQTGSYMDFPLGYMLTQNLSLYAGRYFVPTKVDYPILELYDGSHYNLPLVNSRTGECIKNDKVIVLSELVKNGQLTGYVLTDYAGGFMTTSVEEALSYEGVGYWNATVVKGRLKPLGEYVFSQIVQ